MVAYKLAVLGVVVTAGVVAAGDEGWRSLPWQTIERPFYRLHYVPEHAEDAQRVDALLALVYEALLEEFKTHNPRKMLRSVECDIYLQPQPMEYTRPGVALTLATWSNGHYDADIHILTPGAHGQLDQSGFPPGHYDRDYYHKTLLHEVSTLFLVPLARSKREGWSFSECPEWFRQGYEDYLGLMRSSERNRTERLRDYQGTLADDDRVRLGIEVQEVYIDGAMLLAYMHDTWGPRKVQQVLVSRAPTFWGAVKRELDVDIQAFYDGWQAWRDRHRASR